MLRLWIHPPPPLPVHLFSSTLSKTTSLFLSTCSDFFCLGIEGLLNQYLFSIVLQNETLGMHIGCRKRWGPCGSRQFLNHVTLALALSVPRPHGVVSHYMLSLAHWSGRTFGSRSPTPDLWAMLSSHPFLLQSDCSFRRHCWKKHDAIDTFVCLAWGLLMSARKHSYVKSSVLCDSQHVLRFNTLCLWNWTRFRQRY